MRKFTNEVSIPFFLKTSAQTSLHSVAPQIGPAEMKSSTTISNYLIKMIEEMIFSTSDNCTVKVWKFHP